MNPPPTPIRPFVLAICLVAPCFAGACAGLGGDMDRKPAPTLGRSGQDSESIQGELMSFTDTFISTISQQWNQADSPGAATPAPTLSFVGPPVPGAPVPLTGTPGDKAPLPAGNRARRAALEIKISNVSAALAIATEPNPRVAVADMITVITLQRTVLQQPWAVETFGAEKARRLIDAYREQEEKAWRMGRRVFTEKQQDELRALIAEWRERHPDQRYVAGVRLENFAAERASTNHGNEDSGPGSLLDLLGLDPLANLDPTVREVERSRLLAERIFFYATHSPALLKWQAESLYTGFLNTPDVKQAFTAAADVSDAARALAATADRLRTDLAKERHDAITDLFDQLKREREETIRQVAESIKKERESILHDIDSGQDKLKGTLTEVRETVKAAESLSTSLQGTVKAADTLIAKFAPAPGAPDAEKRDALADFTAAATKAGETVDKLNTLAERIDKLLANPELDAKSGKLRGAIDSLQGGVKDTVNHTFIWISTVAIIAAFCLGLAIAFGLSAHKAMERRSAAKRRLKRTAAV